MTEVSGEQTQAANPLVGGWREGAQSPWETAVWDLWLPCHNSKEAVRPLHSLLVKTSDLLGYHWPQPPDHCQSQSRHRFTRAMWHSHPHQHTHLHTREAPQSCSGRKPGEKSSSPSILLTDQYRMWGPALITKAEPGTQANLIPCTLLTFPCRFCLFPGPPCAKGPWTLMLHPLGPGQWSCGGEKIGYNESQRTPALTVSQHLPKGCFEVAFWYPSLPVSQ